MGRDGSEASEGGGEFTTPLAGEGAASEASEARGLRAKRAREGANPRPRLRGRGLRAKRAGRGRIPDPACGGGGCERSEQGEGEFGCRMSTAKHIIYFSLNKDGSVIPFCSFPNIKSHMKFLA